MKLGIVLAFLLVVNPALGFLSILKDFVNLGKKELWDRGRTDMFGYECNWSRVPKFQYFKIKFKATVHCPGFTPYTGRGWDGNPELAVNQATIDFVKKATEGGFITEAEAKPWMEARR